MRPLALWLLLFTCVWGLLTLVGCDNSALEEQKRELQTIHAEIETLKIQYTQIEKQNGMLASAYHALKSDLDNLNVKNSELEQWSRALVSSYGPSVWTPGTYERPVLYKSFKTASPEFLVQELNHFFKSSGLPSIVLEKIMNHFAYIRVLEDEMLTQQMGTTGASAYLNAIAYTLCSIKEIECVDFDFQQGDHAAPGRLCP